MEEDIVKALVDIRDNRLTEEELNRGICHLLLEKVGYTTYEVFFQYARNTKWFGWKYFSGNINFPIPDPARIHHPRVAFSCYHKWEGGYGELRKDLLNHMIKIKEEK